MPIRYGKQTVVKQDGSVTITEESVFANFLNVKQVTVYSETVRVKDDKEVLTEYLKMLDKWKSGEIDLPAIKPVRDRQGNMRVEKTWMIPD
jgi:hypothetical protein